MSNGIIKIDKNSEVYPLKLKEISSPPEVLYCIGNVELLGKLAVGICGSRKATSYGRGVAKKLGCKCSQSGIVVVSGMAQGIDTFAHIGAVEEGGETIAVFGCGPDICYPKGNRNLMKNIIKNGLIVSEYPEGCKPKPYYFPARNRIISGLSDSVVVVEAGIKSGALITAEFAIEQGKNVYSVPGNITSTSSFGTNKLILDGAMPLVVLDDILRDLDIDIKSTDKLYELLDKEEMEIYKIIKAGGELPIENLYSITMLPIEKINSIITLLELKGLITSSMGRLFIN